jgi:hypothetical protein
MFGLQSPGRALAYTLALLVAGFVWGAIGANVPAIRGARPLPYVAHNWAIALPIFVTWVVLSYAFARKYLRLAGGGAAEGLRLGALFAISAVLYDLIVIAWIIGVGWQHFEQLLLWVTYGLLMLIPWQVGRGMAE